MDENYSKLTDIAYNMHTSGKLDEAESVYKKLLSINPDDLDVKNLYAQLNVALKNYDYALSLFEEIYSKTMLDDVLLNIAKVYMYKNDYIAALSTFEKIKSKDSQVIKLSALSNIKIKNFQKAVELYQILVSEQQAQFTDYFNLSIAYLHLKDNENALKYALNAYDLSQNDIQVNIHLASIYEAMGDYPQAIKYLEGTFEKTTNIDSNLLYKVAVLYKNINDDENAIAYFNEVLNYDPGNKNALLNIAIIYSNYDRNVSTKIFSELIEKYPNDVSLLEYLYTLYAGMLMYEEAYNTIKILINLLPDKFVYYVFAGDSLLEMYRYKEANEMYGKAYDNGIRDDYLVCQYALTFSAVGNDDKAVELYSSVSHNEIARTQRMFAYCRMQNFNEYKDDFYIATSVVKDKDYIENRAKSYFYKYKLDKKYGINEKTFSNLKNVMKTSVYDYQEEYLKKDCKGKSLSGKRLLIYSSHGVGDLFMISRYIKDIQKTVSKIILQVKKSCISLYKYNFPNIEIVSDENIVNENLYDYTISTFSVLYIINPDLKNIRKEGIYLQVSEDIVNDKKSLVTSGKRKIGLFWQGNPVVLPNRSVKFSSLTPLFDIPDCEFYSFQMDKIDKESDDLKKSFPIFDLSQHINNYEDTAGFLRNMDLLITIDSSIAHLAGAMGVKTFLLLPYFPEWRWFYDTKNTPWYDSIKIFKQTEPGNWDQVVGRIKEELYR